MQQRYWLRWVRLNAWMRLRRLLRLRKSPHAIALGTAIGVFVAMTPTVGFQMFIAVALATLLGCSRVAALFPPWISNPVTFVPIYTFNYWIGRLLVSGPRVGEVGSAIREVSRLQWEGSFGEGLRQLRELGGDVLLPLWVGGVLVGALLGGVTYLLMLRLVRLFRERIARKREARARRRAARGPAAPDTSEEEERSGDTR
jgi:uncharacterized protein (DUF2062 family)